MGHGHMHAAYGGGGRRRWDAYVLAAVAVVLFVCGTLAVMGLHRLKDARNFDLLIKQKEEQIHSLNRLLQKERSKVQEAERKTKEMKMQIYNLRDHKSQLNGKLSEMQSTISSLRDEQKTLDLTFQEKENEAKSLHEKYTETLHQKETEIEDLKRQLTRQEALSANITGNALETNNEETGNSADGKPVISMQSEEQKERNVTNSIKNEAKDKESGTLSGEDIVISRKVSNSPGNGGVKMEENEKPRYLKRTTGKRWRAIISKQTERKGSGGRRQRLAEEIGNIHDEEKPRNQENIHDAGEDNVKAKLHGYIDGNTSEKGELYDGINGKNDAAEKNEARGNVQVEGFEESEIGIGRSKSTESAQSDREDKEETDETDF